MLVCNTLSGFAFLVDVFCRLSFSFLMLLDLLAKAQQAAEESGDIAVVRRENEALFKQIQENQKLADDGMKALQESAEAEQLRLKDELAAARQEAEVARKEMKSLTEKAELRIQELDGQLERRKYEIQALDDKILGMCHAFLFRLSSFERVFRFLPYSLF